MGCVTNFTLGGARLQWPGPIVTYLAARGQAAAARGRPSRQDATAPGVIALLIGNKRHQPQPRRPSVLRHPAGRQAPRWPAARQPVDVCPYVAISLWLRGYLDESQGVLCVVHREAWD